MRLNIRSSRPGALASLMMGLTQAAYLPALAQTPHSISLGPAQYLTYPIPASWPNGSFRIEVRSDSFLSKPSADYYFWVNEGASLKLNAGTNTLQATDNFDSKEVFVNLGNVTDFRASVGRDITNQLWCMTVWDGQGNPVGQGSIPIAGNSSSGLNGTLYLLGHPFPDTPSGGGKLAFMRWYTAINCTQPLPIPAEAPSATATQGDLRFENSLKDSGAAKASVTVNGGGSATYVNSAMYPPVAIINPVPTLRAGSSAPVMLTSSSFTSLLGNGTVSGLQWQQLGGLVLGPPLGNGPTAAFTPPVAGTYQIQLTATDALGQIGTYTASVGSVATDSNGVVITGNPVVDKIMGPLTASGTSPWPYYDIAEQELGSTIATAALANPPTLGTPLSGTSQLVNNFAGLVGTGTHYTTEVHVGDSLVVEWNSSDGPGTGRYVDHVTSITDDTHLTFSLFQLSSVITSSSPLTGLTVAHVPPITPSFDPAWWGLNAGAGGNSWNYYGVTVALYRLYYRTGQTKYLTWAEQFADYWWQWAIDHGSGSNVGNLPRAMDLQGQFLRAIDGHPERLPGLFALVKYLENLPGGGGATVGQDCGGVQLCDQREAGYTRLFAAFGAIADPANRATYCGWLTNSLNGTGGTPGWIANQLPAGNWEENIFLWNNGFLAPGPGMSPWRMDIVVMSHELAYDLLNDTSSSGCNDPALAASLLKTITAAVNWVWSAGRSTVNRGIFYDVNYYSSELLTTDPPGTVSVSLGSTTVTGNGTTFTTDFTAGSSWIGFFGPQTGYQVTSISDDTHLTIATAYGSQGESGNLAGAGFASAPSSFTNCGGGAALYCNTGATTGPNAPPDALRDLTRFPPAMTGWLYMRTHDAQYLAWGDEWFSAAFGGPADGPNGSLPCGGPACDGLQTDWAADVFTGNNAFSNLGKNFGEGSGAPAAQTYLAERLGGAAAATPFLVDVTVPIAAFPGATQMEVFVIQPDGIPTSTTCISSPCTVQVDPRQGNHVAMVIYLSPSGQVLAAGDPFVLTVP